MKGRKPSLDNVVPMKDGDDIAPKPVPPAPEFLSDEARRVWDEMAADLVAQDRLLPRYEYQFAAYCEAVSNFIAATHSIAVEGMYYETKTRNGIQQKKRAPFGIQQESMAQMSRLGALFGLSPVDDRRLGAGAQGDLFDEVLKQINGTD
ncbi:MAG: P27 family phage terminase small subunit [Pseudomonadota bacterium]